MSIGYHISGNIQNLMNEALRIKMLGGNIIQLFVDATNPLVKLYKSLGIWLKKKHIKCVVHASYSINLAQSKNEYDFQIKLLISEIKLANKLKAFAIVVHMGKQLDLEKYEAENNMYSSLLYVHQQTMKYKDIKILLETSAGQGTEMFYDMIDLSYFFRKFSENSNLDVIERFGICIDTCHIFASGIDIRKKEQINEFFGNFVNYFGMNFLKLVHLNDSLDDLKSRIDRHADIGEGKIGKEGLMYFAKFVLILGVPIVLETPTLDPRLITNILTNVKINEKVIFPKIITTLK